MDIPPGIVRKAKAGDAAAQLDLAKSFSKATSLKDNYIIAFTWMRCSAEQGNIEAQFRLGDFYTLGYGTKKSLSESYEWYTKAAIQGYKKALARIHNLYQEDIKIHCRGQINSSEEEWTSINFKKENKIRELYEYRLEQHKPVLSNAIEYYNQQFKHYQSSDQKDQFVQLNLAFLYQHGYGVKKCSRWAFEYYSLAAEQGNIDAQYNLGRLYQQHTRKKFNYRHAFKWYTKSAQGGNIAAQRCLAYFYLKGLVVDINYETALFWYTKAAEAGDSYSQITLGKLYRKGDYVDQDLSKAVRWYTLAARQGSIVAQNCLSQLYQRHIITSEDVEDDMMEYFRDDSINSRLCSKLSADISIMEDSPQFKQMNKLAKHALIRDGPAMYEIGLKYYYGSDELIQDKETGVKWIKNAANANYKDAQSMMAELYKKGDSIEQDYHKSSVWYKTVAKQKDAQAQYSVGMMYLEGLGVRKDPLEASKWFTWAADQGNSDAQFNLGKLRLIGEGIKKDKTEAVKWFYKAVCQKNIQACYKLGDVYLHGDDGVKKNLQNSLILLDFAAEHEQMDAQLLLGDMHKDGKDFQHDATKYIKYYTMAAVSGSAEAQYKLAMIYFNGESTNQDYIMAYNWFKQAKENGHKITIKLFETPLKYHHLIDFYSKVRDMFTEVNKKGVDNLVYQIGCIYEYGVKDKHRMSILYEDYPKAKEWYLAASKKGDSRADYRLGIMYENGKGIQKNWIYAMYYYRKAMKRENIDAIFRLACIYREGFGVIQNFTKAFHLYTKASIMGLEKATKTLAILKSDEESIHYFDDDLEVPVERQSQISMLERATIKGHAQNQYQLGIMYEKNGDNVNAFKWFSRAVDIGVTNAYYKLGVFYEKGKCIKQNYNMASKMYQKAAEKDHEDACFRLARLYQYGNSVKLDYLKAFHFYTKAAEMNHHMATKVLNITLESNMLANGTVEENFFDALSTEYQDSLTMLEYIAGTGYTEVQFKLGYAYENSFSEPNYKEAYKWYSIASTTSHKRAMYHLGLLYENGLGVAQDYSKAIELYNRASELNNDDALHRLGVAYLYGKGVKIDIIKAIEYYTLSAKFGNPKYQSELGRLYEEGEFGQKKPLEALKWYTAAYLQGYDEIRPNLYAMYEYEPYENYFFNKLFRILSTASRNYFGLNENYKQSHYGDINNKLGFMCYFGIGTDKDLELSLKYFMKEYSDKPRTSINDFGFINYGNFSFSQRIDILNEFENVDEFVDQLNSDELYEMGRIYYKEIAETQDICHINKEKRHTSHHDPDDPTQHIVTEGDYAKAIKYLKRTKHVNQYKLLVQLAIMYHCGYDSMKEITQSHSEFTSLSTDNIDRFGNTTTQDTIQNFSKAFDLYRHVEETFSDDIDVSKDDRKKIQERVKIGLGMLYEYGDGVQQDYQEAIEYYKTLVRNKNFMGYLRLGLMYYYGKGALVDYDKAFELFQLASRHEATVNAEIYVYDQNSEHTSGDSMRKLVYCTKTRWEIRGESFYYLGLMYKYGQGVLTNEDKAQTHFKKALFHYCKRAENEIKK